MTGRPITSITFLHAGRFEHGVVMVEDAHTIQFTWKNVFTDVPLLKADRTDEGALWVRGWLRWWRPRDWETKKAMRAAAAMGESYIGVTEQEAARQNRWWQDCADAVVDHVLNCWQTRRHG